MGYLYALFFCHIEANDSKGLSRYTAPVVIIRRYCSRPASCLLRQDPHMFIITRINKD